MSFDVNGKVVLVTGANRGIGKEFVKAFVAHGAAKVYAAVRNLETAAPLVEELGDGVVPIHIDLADPDSIYTAAKKADDVQVVVNNAGVLGNATPLEPNAFETLDFDCDTDFDLEHCSIHIEVCLSL